MKQLTIFFILVVGLQIIGCRAQNSFDLVEPESVGMSSERLRQMDSCLHKIVDVGELAGIQTAVLRKGKLVHFDTYGYADLENKKPLSPNSIYRIFSMTKPIVSVALMQLYEEGKFQLNDPVHSYIPEFENMKVYSGQDGLRAAKNPIRIIDLLRHTSGIGYGRSENTYINELYTQAQITNSNNLKQFVTKLSKLPLYFEPGTNWLYGHSTDVCGYLVEVLSGEPLNQYLDTHILTPLLMTDTHFELPKDKIDRLTVGYRVGENGRLVVAENPEESRFVKETTLFLGGGGLVSTMHDYLQFCRMLLNDGTLNGVKILKPETLVLMTKDHLNEVREHQELPLHLMLGETGFGLGFSIAAYEPSGNRGVYGWGGAVGTYFRIDPKQELAYVLMIQLSPYRPLRLRERFPELVNKAILHVN
ncbi:serine hydrolase domain-containing protein [Costertonia aggregata]|uniref:Beta-lactamase family protein n=1 Tax=Costertonia aggregata TaxID=343403 RepID=A0A7H9AMK6_9FLAO|nr:serine hydrolase domain-containing protein [Costertonia aggregata]QLG44603.1 beta-lactamase family protein [Costertonia aggregata]